MGLSGFRNSGDYIKIDTLTFDKTNDQVVVQMGYYSERGGAHLLPINLSIDRDSAIETHKSNGKAALNEPSYPTLCSERESMVPMWTNESTDEEKAEYDAALAAYTTAVETYQAAIEAFETAAETENEYDSHFSASKRYGNGNIEKCIYKWVKTIDVFSGVTDVLEDEDA